MASNYPAKKPASISTSLSEPLVVDTDKFMSTSTLLSAKDPGKLTIADAFMKPSSPRAASFAEPSQGIIK
jgi:hypothetical protein